MGGFRGPFHYGRVYRLPTAPIHTGVGAVELVVWSLSGLLALRHSSRRPTEWLSVPWLVSADSQGVDGPIRGPRLLVGWRVPASTGCGLR